jgi:hypothetical protein
VVHTKEPITHVYLFKAYNIYHDYKRMAIPKIRGTFVTSHIQKYPKDRTP